MALTQTLAQMRTNVRHLTDTGGTTSLARHPDSALNDYINRALGSLHRRLTEQLPDQRFLSSTTITTLAGVTTYALPALFDHLISVDLTVDSRKTWLDGYQMTDRPALTDPSASYQGTPLAYRLRGGNIEYLPAPIAGLTSTLWYVPTPTQLTADGQTYDTINRLDDYVIAYAGRLVATRDKAWDLVGECRAQVSEMIAEIEALGRSRDKNAVPRVTDEQSLDRYGRRSRR
jgi:hypothetical protein